MAFIHEIGVGDEVPFFYETPKAYIDRYVGYANAALGRTVLVSAWDVWHRALDGSYALIPVNSFGMFSEEVCGFMWIATYAGTYAGVVEEYNRLIALRRGKG